jgi:hypothetical protein
LSFFLIKNCNKIIGWVALIIIQRRRIMKDFIAIYKFWLIILTFIFIIFDSYAQYCPSFTVDDFLLMFVDGKIKRTILNDDRVWYLENESDGLILARYIRDVGRDGFVMSLEDVYGAIIDENDLAISDDEDEVERDPEATKVICKYRLGNNADDQFVSFITDLVDLNDEHKVDLEMAQIEEAKAESRKLMKRRLNMRPKQVVGGALLGAVVGFFAFSWFTNND